MLILQHPRERHVPINTVRLARLCLPDATMRRGVELEDDPVVADVLAGRGGWPTPYLLFPGPKALDLSRERPPGPITLVVPFAAGGSIDVLARLAAQQASAGLGQPIVVDNRGGAAGLVGAATVAKAEPDGYTLLMASAAQVTIPPWINRSLSFDPPRDLAPVAHVVDTPMALIVSSWRLASADQNVANSG